MASQCPKCHEPLDEEGICCAGIEFQWRCVSCYKRTRGFAVPFGRCELCGGTLERLSGKNAETDARILALQEAFQIEVSSHLFYRRLAAAVDDPQVSDFFESLAEQEREHALELERKYHIHLGRDPLRYSGGRLPYPFFDDLCFFANSGEVSRLFDCAIALEKRTQQFFVEKAAQFAAGALQDLYRELAAEEEGHVTLLETEKERGSGNFG